MSTQFNTSRTQGYNRITDRTVKQAYTVIVVSLLIFLAACSTQSSPKGTAETFVLYASSGNRDQLKDVIVEDYFSKDAVIRDWSKCSGEQLNFELWDQDDNSMHYNVYQGTHEVGVIGLNKIDGNWYVYQAYITLGCQVER